MLRKKFYENVEENFNKKQKKNYKNVAQQIKKLVQNRKIHNKVIKTESDCLKKVMTLMKTLNMWIEWTDTIEKEEKQWKNQSAMKTQLKLKKTNSA